MMNNKKIFGIAAIITLSLIVLSVFVSFASALTMPPVISINATPSPATITSTVTAVGVDLSGSGIANINIYEDGNLVKQCFSSTCVYTAFHATPAIRNYYAVVSDNVGSVTTSKKVYVIFQNNAPVLNFIGSKSVNQSSLLMFAISGFDYNNDSLTYSASGLPIGATFNPANGVFSWTPTYSQFGDYYVNFSVSDGYSTDSELVKINVIDVLFPTYSGLSVNPSSPAIYTPAQTYVFSSVWADNIAVANVLIEFNGVNYAVNGTSGVYSFTISDLAAGNYAYRWFASDLSGNTNQTPLTNYTVNKAVPPISISFLPSSSVGSNIQTTATGIGCPAQLICKLYRNGVEVNNSDIASLSDGTYNYVYNTSGNENYTSKSVSSALYINVASGNGGSNGGKTRVVSDSDLANGYYVYLNIDDKLKFNLCGAPYYITLTDIDTEDDNAYFRINPGLKSFVLGEEDKEEFDFNLNGVKDIVFRVEKIESNRVKIYIKKLADVCAVQGEQASLNDFVEKLDSDEEKSILKYVIIWLIFGILLAALADLLLLFGRSKKKI